MQSSNPVLTRLGESARRERSSGATAGYGYDQPYSPVQDATGARMMTLDDVVVRTVALLAITGVTGALAWSLLPDNGALTALAMFGSVIAGLVLGLVISFARVTNPLVISAYAVLQGVMLGVASRFFEQRYPGIVIQAVIGTFGVFAVMAVLYKMRVLRATPRFTKVVVGALIGVVLLIVVNLLLSLFGVNLGIRDNGTGPVGPVPIIFSLVVIVVGALTFILDFDQVEKGIQYGMPERFAWYCAFGLLVGLIFLYWEILRLLSYLRR